MKKLSAFFLSCILAFLCFCFLGCAKAKEPWDYPNVEWVSDKPLMFFKTEYSGEPSIGYIEQNGERKDVCLTWGPPTYTFTVYEYDIDGDMDSATILLRGRVEYDQDSATLVIEVDNLFMGEYEEICLSRIG